MIILTEVNKKFNATYMYLFDKFRNIIVDHYLYNDYYEYRNCKDNYIRYFYYRYKLNNYVYFNYSGEYHREDGPAYIKYNKNEKIWFKEYFLNDKRYSYEDYILEIKKLVLGI